MRKAAQLIGDEVSGETKATVVLTTTRRTRWCLGFDLYWPQPIAATRTADGGKATVELRRRRAYIAPPKHGTSYTVSRRSYPRT